MPQAWRNPRQGSDPTTAHHKPRRDAMLVSVCGRYAASRDLATLEREFDIPHDESAPDLVANHNVAPTQQVPIVLTEERDHTPLRRIVLARWGLVPSWADDPSIGSRMINARVESVTDKPAYRSAIRRRRCIVPADGFYEWAAAGAGTRVPKQPFFVHLPDDAVLPMAGIYETWHDPARTADDPHGTLLTVAILTRDALGVVADIHDRMPVLVGHDLREDWLDPTTPAPDVLSALLADPLHGQLAAHPVGRAVNNVHASGPDLRTPVAASSGGEDPELTLF